MAKTFSDVSKTIIDEAIEKVLYIDNEIAIPFKDDSNHKDFLFCSNLFDSFQENNSIVDFYRFSTFDDWSKRKDFFKGADLLILDWKLNDTEKFGFESTLRILNKAIHTDNLHFVNIYSAEPEFELQKITFYIKAYFSGLNPTQRNIIGNWIEEFLEGIGINPDEFTEKISVLTFRLTNSIKSERGNVFTEIKSFLRTELKTHESDFITYLKDSFEVGEYDCFFKLAYVLNDVFLEPDVNHKLSSKIISDKFLFLNHTIIQISNKDLRKPVEFYDSFREAIIGSTKNFMTIMGLEMRNRFKKNSAFIGKDIDQISDLAFFFHKDHNQNSEAAFYNFLKNIWKDQSSSFLYAEGMELEIFSVLDNYKLENDIDNQIESGKKNSKFDRDLALLNYYYNRLRVKRKDNDQIKFGDIFSINEEKTKFLLCITAHCDCLYPSNINNSFFFVEGYKVGINSGLKKGDSGFNSFLIDENQEPFAIDWKEKPFTIFISDDSNVVGSDITATLHGEEKVLKYFGTIKDNYTQRIANNAFSHPLRVGVYFADRKDLSNGD